MVTMVNMIASCKTNSSLCDMDRYVVFHPTLPMSRIQGMLILEAHLCSGNCNFPSASEYLYATKCLCKPFSTLEQLRCIASLITT